MNNLTVLCAKTNQKWLPVMQDGQPKAKHPELGQITPQLPDGAYIFAAAEDITEGYFSAAWVVRNQNWCLELYQSDTELFTALCAEDVEGLPLSVLWKYDSGTSPHNQQLSPEVCMNTISIHFSDLRAASLHSSCAFLPAYYQGYPVIVSKNIPSILLNVDNGTVIFADGGTSAWMKAGTAWAHIRNLDPTNIAASLGNEWCPAEDLPACLFQLYVVTL